MTLIELGEVSSSSPETPPEPRRIRRQDLRWPAAVALAVICVLTMTASAVPAEPRGLRTLWSTPIGAQPFDLDGDTLYRVVEGDVPAVAAYEASSGRLRWSHPVDREPDWMDTSVPGVLILPQTPEAPDGGSSGPTTTVVVDERTGSTRWRQPGQPAFGNERGVLLVDQDNETGDLRGLRMVRLADGGELWSYAPSEPPAAWTTTGSWFATIDRTGRIEVHRLADGSLLGTGSAPWLGVEPDEQNGDYSYLFGTGDVLLVVQQQDGVQTINAHDTRTMARIWTRRGEGRGGTFACGRLICAGDRPGVVAIDPATGSQVWSSPGWDYAQPLDDHRLLYQSNRDTNQGVVDSRTGRILTVFPNGMVTADPANGDVVVLSFSITSPSELTVHRLRHGRLEVRGALGGSTDQGCRLSDGRLACLIGSGNKGYHLVVKAVA